MTYRNNEINTIQTNKTLYEIVVKKPKDRTLIFSFFEKVLASYEYNRKSVSLLS